VINTSRNPLLLTILIGNIDPFLALVGPFILYYFKSIVKGKLVYDKLLILLLIPSVLSLINLIPLYSIPFDVKLSYFEHISLNSNPLPYLYLPVPLQLDLVLVYDFVLIIYAVIYIHKIKMKPDIIKRKKLINLINQILVLLAFIILGDLVLVSILGITSENFYAIKNTSKIINKDYLCFYINLILPIFFFLVPDLLFYTKIPFTIGSNDNKSIIPQENVESINDLSFEIKNDKALILEFLKNDKPYLKPDFSVHHISKHLNIPNVRVTNCFNRTLNTSFPAYRNYLRLEHAISLIESGEHLNTSIEGISHLSGFKSKTIFYEVFRKHYGITPSRWIKKNYIN
jgi:AraC-like DNA-binding protein